MPHLRIHFREPDGSIHDGQVEFPLETFAGQVPAIGDTIVDPGVLQGLDRHEPQNRRVWTVVGRVFNPRDREDAVALVVEARDGNMGDQAFL